MSVAAERTYARVSGWIFLALGAAGLLTRDLGHMLQVGGILAPVHLAIGLAGIATANRGGVRARRIFNLTLGCLLTAWGVAGTLEAPLLSPAPLPLENGLHALIGIWGFYGPLGALWAKWTRRKPAA